MNEYFNNIHKTKMRVVFIIITLIIGNSLLSVTLCGPEENAGYSAIKGKIKPEPLLLVGNKHSITLCFINPNTLEVIETIATGLIRMR